MAVRGTKKELSVRQEEYIARSYQGKRSESSGGAAHDAGDVRMAKSLCECKYTGSPGEPLKGQPKILKEFEKVAREAWSEGRDPMMALRIYWPESPLANKEGWVDFTVRLTTDDVERELTYAEDGQE